MKIVIIGFDDYHKLDQIMNKLIEEKQYYLFYVICGGQDRNGPETIGETWAKKNGLPQIFMFEERLEYLLDKIAAAADYIVADFSTDSQYAKRLVMKMKSLGKHGTVV